MKEIIIPAQKTDDSKKNALDLANLKAKVEGNEHFQKLEAVDVDKVAVSSVKFFLSLLVLSLLVGASFVSVGRVASTFFTLYPANDGRAWDSEPVRWGLSHFPVTKVVHFIQTELDPDDTIMVFRQSDLSYYLENKLAVNTDNRYAYLFYMDSPVELKEELIKLDIHYLVMPGYGLAEVNNSAFSTLFGRSDLVDIIFEEGNERVFRLRADAPPPKQLIKDFDLKTEAGNKVWKATRFPMSLNETLGTPEATVDHDLSAGSVTLSRAKPPLARRELVDVLQPWDINLQTSPSAIGQTEFQAENGIYQYDGHIKADGRIQLILELDLLMPDTTKRLQRILLWDDVLDDREKHISGQAMINFSGNAADPKVKDARSARLYFTMRQGGYLTLKDLNIFKVKDPEERSYNMNFGKHKSAFEAGWEYDDYMAKSGYPMSIHKFNMGDDGVVTVTQTDSAPVSVKAPKFILPSEYMEELDALKLNRTSRSVAPKLRVSYKHGGYGGLNPVFEAQCLNDQDANSDGISLSLSPISLRMPMRTDVEEVFLPCIPTSAKLVFNIDRDTMRIPPDFKLAQAKFSDIEINVEVWKDALTTLNISYIEANEITPYDGVSNPTVTPLSVDF